MIIDLRFSWETGIESHLREWLWNALSWSVVFGIWSAWSAPLWSLLHNSHPLTEGVPVSVCVCVCVCPTWCANYYGKVQAKCLLALNVVTGPQRALVSPRERDADFLWAGAKNTCANRNGKPEDKAREPLFIFVGGTLHHHEPYINSWCTRYIHTYICIYASIGVYCNVPHRNFHWN